LQEVTKAVHALDKLGRVLDSPDRSNLFTTADPSTLDSAQIQLLRRWIDACDDKRASVTFTVDNLVTGLEIRKQSPEGTEKIEGSLEDIEYLCRVGALSGCYRDGMLHFNVSPAAKAILQSRQVGVREGKRQVRKQRRR
jgi:hypothetical protein